MFRKYGTIALGKQLLIAHTQLIVHTLTCITMWTPQYGYVSQLVLWIICVEFSHFHLTHN